MTYYADVRVRAMAAVRGGGARGACLFRRVEAQPDAKS